MADRTKIEWTDATWNPVAGCSVVSPACTNCYAMTMAHRLRAMGQQGGQAKYADLTQVVNDRPVWTGKTFFDALVLDHPLRWKRPRRIFVVSMGDLFHESVPNAWIARVWAIMALCPQHTFQVLTKRPERAGEWLRHQYTPGSVIDSALVHVPLATAGWSAPREGLPWPLPNVWLGTTVEDQARADERIPHLLDAPAALHFLSCEPLLGPVDLTKVHDRRRDLQPYVDVLEPDCVAELNTASIRWVIAGGESGGRARPSRPEWFRTLRDQCAHAGVPFFFKQWGGMARGRAGLHDDRRRVSASEHEDRQEARRPHAGRRHPRRHAAPAGDHRMTGRPKIWWLGAGFVIGLWAGWGISWIGRL